MNLLEEIKADYDLCINNPHEYQRKVNSISDLFSLKGRQRLKGDNCPAYIIGMKRLHCNVWHKSWLFTQK
jgi:hypothetical protein